MFRTLLKIYIERFKHDPKFIDFSIYLLLHVLPFVERIKKCLTRIQTTNMPENARMHVSMAPGNSSKIVIASLMGKRNP